MGGALRNPGDGSSRPPPTTPQQIPSSTFTTLPDKDSNVRTFISSAKMLTRQDGHTRRRSYGAIGTDAGLTVQHRLVQAPVDAQAVLLLLHASFTLAAVQRRGQKRRHGVLTLVSRSGPQLHAAVARHTLPEGAQSWAARVVAGAGVAGAQAVPASRGQRQAWDSCDTEDSDFRENPGWRRFPESVQDIWEQWSRSRAQASLEKTQNNKNEQQKHGPSRNVDAAQAGATGAVLQASRRRRYKVASSGK